MIKKKDKEIFDIPEGVKVLEKFNLKRIVEGRGHDGGGLIADLCLKSKVLATFHDDGWGGEPEIRFLDENSENLVENTLKNANFGQIMFDCGWHFMGKPEDINFDTQVDFLVSSLSAYRDIQKMMKNTKKWLIFGTRRRYRYYAWKNVTDLSQVSSGRLQAAYFKAKLTLKDGEKFFNTPEQLISLGIPKERL